MTDFNSQTVLDSMNKTKFPEGTTHVHYNDRFMGHWEYWKQTESWWFKFDVYSFSWEALEPCSWNMPKSILGDQLK